jgi:hypothetical protein
MKNRHERRAVKKRAGGGAVFVAYGNILEGDPNFGVPVVCFVCDTPHKAFNLTRITDGAGTHYAPLCATCFLRVGDGDRVPEQAIVRKHLNAPNLAFSEGGEASTEQVLALAEKQGVAVH